MKTYIILVAGYDYANGGVNFSFIADKRRLHLLQQNPAWQNDTNVVFIRFDVKAGKIERNTSNGTTRMWTEESSSSFAPVNRAQHYQQNQLKQAETNLMSITDCYRYVVNIGQNEPGTVKEFSILGHGWFGGPVLLNSFQRSEFSSGVRGAERDSWDKDGRTKDFFVQNMNEGDWNNFKRAFATDGYCWVWGCLFSRTYFDTLYKIMQTEAFRSKSLGNHADGDTFTITVNPAFVTSHYYVDPQFFPTNPNERSFTRSLAEVKNFLKRGLKRSYPGRFTADTGVPCRAAYLGTYSDYERVHAGHNPTHTVMIVPRNITAYGTDFTRTINFFKTYLGIPEDPENRGYASYLSTHVNQWWRDTA